MPRWKLFVRRLQNKREYNFARNAFERVEKSLQGKLLRCLRRMRAIELKGKGDKLAEAKESMGTTEMEQCAGCTIIKNGICACNLIGGGESSARQNTNGTDQRNELRM